MKLVGLMSVAPARAEPAGDVAAREAAAEDEGAAAATRRGAGSGGSRFMPGEATDAPRASHRLKSPISPRRARARRAPSGSPSGCRASCVREVMPSFVNTLRRCASIVRGERKSWAATSLLERPCPTKRATWSSCGVSWSSVLGSRLRAVSPDARSSARARSAQRRRAERLERRERRAELLARVDAATLPPQVLAVRACDAREVERARVVGERQHRLEVRGRLVALGEQRAAAGAAARAPSARPSAWPTPRTRRSARAPAPGGRRDRRLDQVGQHERRHQRIGVARRPARAIVVEARERLRPAAAAESSMASA